MTEHELKVWIEYFNPLLSGDKTFEVRKDDRDFAVGDSLYLREYDSEKKKFTGRKIFKTVTYIMRGPAFGIAEGYCVMGLKDYEP